MKPKCVKMSVKCLIMFCLGGASSHAALIFDIIATTETSYGTVNAGDTLSIQLSIEDDVLTQRYPDGSNNQYVGWSYSAENMITNVTSSSISGTAQSFTSNSVWYGRTDSSESFAETSGDPYTVSWNLLQTERFIPGQLFYGGAVGGIHLGLRLNESIVHSTGPNAYDDMTIQLLRATLDDGYINFSYKGTDDQLYAEINSITISSTTSYVPEPTALSLLGLGVLSSVLTRRR